MGNKVIKGIGFLLIFGITFFMFLLVFSSNSGIGPDVYHVIKRARGTAHLQGEESFSENRTIFDSIMLPVYTVLSILITGLIIKWFGRGVPKNGEMLDNDENFNRL